MQNEEEALQQALAMWQERERTRIAFLASLTEARNELASGKGKELTEAGLQELSKSIKERGRARLAAQLSI